MSTTITQPQRVHKANLRIAATATWARFKRDWLALSGWFLLISIPLTIVATIATGAITFALGLPQPLFLMAESDNPYGYGSHFSDADKGAALGIGLTAYLMSVNISLVTVAHVAVKRDPTSAGSNLLAVAARMAGLTLIAALAMFPGIFSEWLLLPLVLALVPLQVMWLYVPAGLAHGLSATGALVESFRLCRRHLGLSILAFLWVYAVSTVLSFTFLLLAAPAFAAYAIFLLEVRREALRVDAYNEVAA